MFTAVHHLTNRTIKQIYDAFKEIYVYYLHNKGELSVVWCPTGDMIGDFATKPLQGALFRKFRDQIMGVMPAMDPGLGKSKPPASNKRKGKK